MDSTVREALFELCELYDRDGSPVLISLWEDSLRELNPDALASAFTQLKRTFVPTAACPFPVPAHIHNLVKDAATLASEAEAELAWQELLKRLPDYHPDLGWRGEALPGRTSRAVNYAGGTRFIWNAEDDQMVWIKKEFVKWYKRDDGPEIPESVALPNPE